MLQMSQDTVILASTLQHPGHRNLFLTETMCYNFPLKYVPISEKKMFLHYVSFQGFHNWKKKTETENVS